MSKTKKFFMICGIVFVVGIGLLLAGRAIGGHVMPVDQLSIGSGENGVNMEVGDVQSDSIVELSDFRNIEVEGKGDVVIVGTDSIPALMGIEEDGYQDFSKDIINQIIEDASSDLTDAVAGTVICNYVPETGKPQVTLEDSTLKIKTNSTDTDIMVVCPQHDMDSIKVKNVEGDTVIGGITYGEADVEAILGDIQIVGVTSNGMKVINTDGETEISGIIKGTTEIGADSGDVEVQSQLDKSQYTIDVTSDIGTIECQDSNSSDDKDYDEHYKSGSGPNKLIIKTLSGDVELELGTTR